MIYDLLRHNSSRRLAPIYRKKYTSSRMLYVQMNIKWKSCVHIHDFSLLIIPPTLPYLQTSASSRTFHLQHSTFNIPLWVLPVCWIMFASHFLICQKFLFAYLLTSRGRLHVVPSKFAVYAGVRWYSCIVYRQQTAKQQIKGFEGHSYVAVFTFILHYCIISEKTNVPFRFINNVRFADSLLLPETGKDILEVSLRKSKTQ